VADAYAKQIDDIGRRPAAPVVRLCKPARQSGVPSTAAARPADGAGTDRELPGTASADIGQRLFNLADDADREALKLKWLQDWNRALAQQ
jgi:hypothetical protein